MTLVVTPSGGKNMSMNSKRAAGDRYDIGGYPLAPHLWGLLPLAVTIGLVWFNFGSEDRTTAFFTLYREAHPRLTALVEFFTDWGNAAFYLAYAVLVLAGWRTGNRGLTGFALGCLLAHLVVVVLAEPLIKAAIGRPRPLVEGPFISFAGDDFHNSFPSGHTTSILGLTVPLGQRCGRPVLWGLAAALMGFSRLYLSRHHPSDLLGSMALSAVLCYLAWRFSQNLRPGR